MKKIKLTDLIVLFLFLINLYIFSEKIYRSYVKIETVQAINEKINIEIQLLNKELDEYNQKISVFSNPFEREKIARNKLQMIKENEVIYRFVEEK